MKKLFIIIILLISLSLVAYFLYVEKSEEDLPGNIESSANDLTHSDDFSPDNLGHIVSDESTNSALSSDQAVSLFQSAANSKSAMEIVHQLLEDGNKQLAKNLLKEIHGRCQYKTSFSSPTGDSSSWALSKLQDYCEDYDSKFYDGFFENNEPFVSLNPDVSKLIYSDETDIDIISQNFIDSINQMYISSSDFMAEVSKVLYFYNSEFHVPLNLGQSERVNLSDLQRVQMAAIELYGCERHGGCGSNSYNVLMMCLVDLSCEQNWTLMDYYQNTLSPNNFNEVMNIMDFIRRNSTDP